MRDVVASPTLADASPLQRAAYLLDRKLEGLAPDSEANRRLRNRLGAVAASLELSKRLARTKPTEEACEAFLICIGAGLTVSQATAFVGSVRESSWYKLKQDDPEFRQRWDDALDQRTEPVLSRLHDIALHGSEELMATVNAARLILENQSSRQRRDIAAAKSAERASRGGNPVLIQVNGATVQLPD